MNINKGVVISKYSIHAALAKGGMAELYEAVDTKTNRKVVLKLGRTDLNNPVFSDAIRYEGQLLSNLKHPGIVQVLPISYVGKIQEPLYFERAIGIQGQPWFYVMAMKESAGEVQSGVKRANSSGEVLNKILVSVESVYKQAEEAVGAAASVSSAASELVNSVDAVSAVIEQNTAATHEMSTSSNELSRAIENIASVSEENSASTEEVYASIEQVSSQVHNVSGSADELMNLAHTLQQVVSKFKLN